MLKKKALIYGAGQLGQLAADILTQSPEVEVVGFLDDDVKQKGHEYAGLPILGGAELAGQLRSAAVTGALVSVGDNSARGRLADNLAAQGFELISAIDSTAIISPTAKLGKGCIIAAGVVVCSNSVVGNHVYIGPGAIVSHHCTVGDNALLSVGCNIAARVDIGRGAFIGAGATVVPAQMSQSQRLRVGDDAVVGAGAVVLKDVPANSVAVGIPAKVVRQRDAPSGNP